MPDSFSQDTTFIHSGDSQDAYHSLTPPIYRATTYHQPHPWTPSQYDYARSGNPTRQAFEEAMAEIEGGSRGLAFASGMAALTAVFLLFSAGDHLIVTRDCQGGTQRVLRGVFSQFDIDVSYIDTDRLDAVKEARRLNTRAILVENFSNPFLGVTDIAALAAWAHQENLLVLVDNTFITPYLQNPLTLGADIVIHSATKMISGHSDVTAGVAVTRSAALGEKLYFIQNSCGMALSPEDSYLALRGLRTLPIRMERAQTNALQLANALTRMSKVTAVYYPGLPEHPGHDIVQRTVKGSGSMLTFRVTEPEVVQQLVSQFRFIMVGAGFGGTETIVSLPELHCHAALTPEERTQREITSDVVRVSLGLEEAHDIIAEFGRALDAY